MLPKYENGLLQIMASIRHYLHLESNYQDDKDLSLWLNKHQFKKIIVLLIDGMGSRIIEKKLDSFSFLRTYQLKEVETVFPPTTSAATISVLTGKSPKENGWLGWHQYFKEKDDSIVMFLGNGFYSGKNYNHYPNKELKYYDIIDELNDLGFNATKVFPSFDPIYGVKDYEAMLDKIVDLSYSNVDFAYVYYDAFDTLMHKEGVSNSLVDKQLRYINDTLEEMVAKLDDSTGLVVLADHGQIDTYDFDLRNDCVLCSYLSKKPFLETRTVAFCVKDNCKKDFEKYFLERYGNYFELLNKKEVIDSNLFGLGEAHPRFEEFIGDYIALAKDRMCLTYHNSKMKGQHAGTCIDEIMIPIIVYPK